MSGLLVFVLFLLFINPIRSIAEHEPMYCSKFQLVYCVSNIEKIKLIGCVLFSAGSYYVLVPYSFNCFGRGIERGTWEVQ